MNLNEIISNLGKPASTLQSSFLSSGIDIAAELKLPSSEFRTYLERPSFGYSLVFTDEAVFLGKKKQPVGVGPLYFSGIFLYSEGKDGYSQFQGEIPFGIEFSKKHDELVSLLGAPNWQRLRDDGTIAAERWDEKGVFRIHITYSTNGKIVIISLQKPDEK